MTELFKKNVRTIIIFLNVKTIGKIYEIDACHCSSYVIRKPKESTIKEENGGLKAEIEDSMGNATGAAVLCLLLGETLVWYFWLKCTKHLRVITD